MNQIKTALIQQSCSSNRQENIHKTTEAIRSAAAQGAKLVILQRSPGPRLNTSRQPPKRPAVFW
jgi:predicted amidohydrolase